MFEQRYTRANDRIHPRADLRQELEAKWAAEQAKAPQEEERGRIVPFPAWARYASVAAGVLLCVGVGMGSMLLYARSQGIQKSASAEMKMTASGAVAQEEAYILTESAMETAAEDGALPPEAMLMTSLAAAPAQGMHPAQDEAEVEDAVLYSDRGQLKVDMEAADGAKLKAAAVNEVRYPAGDIRQRNELIAVFMPTTSRVRVIQYANRKVSNLFSLDLSEKGAQAKQVFWLENQMVGVQETDGEVRLIRTDVTSWSAPRHLRDLTQSGAFLTAAEMGGRIFTLSLYEAGEEEPWPWVDGQRMDYADVLLDSARPGSVYTVVTAYDPQGGDGFAAQTAILAEARGALVEDDRLLLWAGEEESCLYVFTWGEEGLTLTAEDLRPGTVLGAGLVGENYEILLQQGEDVTMLTVDPDLNEVRADTAQAVGTARFAAVYEGGAAVLTETSFHWLSGAVDAAVETAADTFTWLAPDRGLLISADGKLQVVDIEGPEPVLRGTVQLRESLQLLVEDPSRLAFELETGRVAFPAGQKVYQYVVSDQGDLTHRGTLTFSDHNETEQRELRCRYEGDRTLVFYKSGVIVCNQNLEKQMTYKY